MRCAKAVAFIFAACLDLMTATLGHADEVRPQRVVSLNMCTDELLLRLADPGQIASVSWLSQDPRNANLPDEAKLHPANHGLAEEVLSYDPDLVLAGAFTTRTTVALLKRTGMRVIEVGVPRSFAETRQNIRDIARALGQQSKGEALIREMDERLEQLAAQVAGPPLKAIVLRPNGFTVGRGSLIDEILKRAGLDNLAARLEIDNYLQIPLEAVVLQKTEILILNGDSESAPSLATQALHHPIVTALAEKLRLFDMPSRLWTCAGPSIVDAVQLLIERTRAPSSERPPS
ncbi:MAG: ABC transporter substrate-binding protein [Hyphomicrobiales bacterium]|nr:ABC transporter substrate-binding protein [Hyphomicrobiales bacterium]